MTHDYDQLIMHPPDTPSTPPRDVTLMRYKDIAVYIERESAGTPSVHLVRMATIEGTMLAETDCAAERSDDVYADYLAKAARFIADKARRQQ